MKKIDKPISVVLLSDDTIDEQLRVYRAAFSTRLGYEEKKQQWIAKHHDNPLGHSLFFGAYMDGVLVGMNGYMPMEYKYGGKSIKVLQSCESGVVPEARGYGIWSKVVNYAVDYVFANTDYKAIIGFPNYRNSYPGFQKMGWRTVLSLSNMVMVNNVGSFVSKEKGLSRILKSGIALQRVIPWSKSCCQKKYEIKECGINELLWDDKNDVLNLLHDESTIQWQKNSKGLKSLSIMHDNVVIATVIYGFGHFNGLPIIKIQKIVSKEESVTQLSRIISLVLQYFSKHYTDVAFVRIWALEDTELYNALKHTMFVKSSHPNPFIIKEKDDWFMNKQWNLSFWDLDSI